MTLHLQLYRLYNRALFLSLKTQPRYQDDVLEKKLELRELA